jgi:hypothetical protein
VLHSDALFYSSSRLGSCDSFSKFVRLGLAYRIIRLISIRANFKIWPCDTSRIVKRKKEEVFVLEISRRLNSMKSSRAISRVGCLYWTDVSRTISVVIIIIIIIMDPDHDRNVGSVQTPDAADSPRRFRGKKELFEWGIENLSTHKWFTITYNIFTLIN